MNVFSQMKPILASYDLYINECGPRTDGCKCKKAQTKRRRVSPRELHLYNAFKKNFLIWSECAQNKSLREQRWPKHLQDYNQ